MQEKHRQKERQRKMIYLMEMETVAEDAFV